jgi:LuxR family transcriptional regulator, maltose regulon positive regulatory protein
MAVFADADSAARELGHVRKSDETLTDPDLLVTTDLVELILGQKASDADAVDAAAHRLLGRSGGTSGPSMPGFRAAVLLAQASTHLWHGRHEDVGSLLDEALAEAQRDEMPGIELEVLAMTAFVDSYWSRPNRADEVAQRARSLCQHKDLAIPPALELAAALRALIAADLGGLARALQRVLLLDTVGADPGLSVALVLGQASVLMAAGEVAEARTMLREAGRRIPPMLAALRDIMLADLDTSLGRPRAALRLLRNHRAGEFAVLTAMPRTRAYLALGDLGNAHDCVRSVLATPSAQTGRFALVEALLHDAQITLRRDDPVRALEVLIRACEVARGEIVLPFLQVKDVFTALLARHADVAGQWPMPRQRISPEAIARPGTAVSRDLPEPLTQRELTILRFLATTMSTAEIADELCLSVNTVKTHIASIYRKLPATRRREAVLRARELELI